MALARRVGEMDLEEAQATNEKDALKIRLQVMYVQLTFASAKVSICSSRLEEMGSFGALLHHPRSPRDAAEGSELFQPAVWCHAWAGTKCVVGTGCKDRKRTENTAAV
mmetsp:Transcript_25486/g.59319  ORF Transcript_25486/g.59319 Transcript_25486/m.59319 type:complete len:108 (+) Transcript_25486:124-447(+)